MLFLAIYGAQQTSLDGLRPFSWQRGLILWVVLADNVGSIAAGLGQSLNLHL